MKMESHHIKMESHHIKMESYHIKMESHQIQCWSGLDHKAEETLLGQSYERFKLYYTKLSDKSRKEKYFTEINLEVIAVYLSKTFFYIRLLTDDHFTRLFII
jgi:hypothetical protein